jgi:undecaprenyl-diphosphatase
MDLRDILRLDVRVSEGMRLTERPGALRSAAVFFAHSGDSWFWGAALVLLWLFSNSFWKHWAIIVLGGISLLAALVMGLKFLIRRRRPEGDWGSIYRNTDPHSFPSGHAARAFLIAVLATGLGPAWAACTLWLWAPLVSLARVAMGVHYISDIAAGLVVGVVFGLAILQVQQPFLAWLAAILKFPFW